MTNKMHFTRRALLAGFSIFLHFHVSAQQAARPNIIFILTDDQRADAIGYAGNVIIKTPEMDRLARAGVYFEKALVTTPICAASRASLLTGLYERTHGYTFGQGQLKQPYMEMSYPVILKNDGYYTGFFGKFGVTYKNSQTLFDEAEFDIPSNEGVRTEKGKYFRYRFIDAREKLYDLESDPLEECNLAAHSDYRYVLATLRSEVDRQTQQYEKAR